MLTDLVQIRRLGEKQRDENMRFRKYLKDHRHDDRRLRRIAEGIEEQIDCTQCANCCRTAATQLTQRDIERLSKVFRLSIPKFVERYCEPDPEPDEPNGLILKRNENGCIFLEGNLCAVYDDRPGVCAQYPHLVRSPGSIASRMWSIVDRAAFCPIVYNTLESWKDHLNFRRPDESRSVRRGR